MAQRLVALQPDGIPCACHIAYREHLLLKVLTRRYLTIISWEKHRLPRLQIEMLQFDDNDRAILEGQTEGFVKIHVKQGTDRILGATIVGEGAGDMIRCVMDLRFLQGL